MYALDSEAYQGPRRRTSITDTETISSRRTIPTEEGRRSLDSFESEAVEDEGPDGTQGAFSPRLRGRQGWSSESYGRPPSPHVPDVVVQDTEETPLLPKSGVPQAQPQRQQKTSIKSTASRPSSRGLKIRVGASFAAGRKHLASIQHSISNPKHYTRESAVRGALASLQTISAVFLGLLLNILDALSYGYILFPLGSPIFSQTGPDGISIFFVSCIVSQLCYSLGLSVFRGGVGSEMIEVVPFFHKMAYSIMGRMQGKSTEAIIATTIVSYCLSSVVTGLIFLALGGFKLGNLVSFFPRHILIGCIGGVGFFLVVTGIEVSARLEGNLNYDLATLHKLFAKDTVYLWMIPLALAITVLFLRRKMKSPFVLPTFFIVVFAVFYIIVKGALRLDLGPVRDSGWIFEQPEAGVPFYRFYSYFSKGPIKDLALAVANASQSSVTWMAPPSPVRSQPCLHFPSSASFTSPSTFPLWGQQSRKILLV